MSGDSGDSESAQFGIRGISLAARSSQRWRDKLKDKAAKLTAKPAEKGATSQEDVSAFLRPESQQSSYSSTNLAAPPQPPAHGSAYSSRGTSPVPPDRAHPPPPRNRPPWKFRRKLPPGLHVSFTSQEPDVIGEGGDESEVPSQDVRGTWAGPGPLGPEAAKPRPAPPDALLAGGGSGGPGPPPASLTAGSGPSRDQDDDDASQRLSLARNPTRKPVGGWHHKRRSMNMEEGLVQAQAGDRATNGPPNILGGELEKSPITSPSAGMGYAPLELAHLRSPQESERPSSARSDDQHSLLGGFRPYNPAAPAAAPSSAPAAAASSHALSAKIQEDELSPTMSYTSHTTHEPAPLTSPSQPLEGGPSIPPGREPPAPSHPKDYDVGPDGQYSMAAFQPKKQGSSTSYHPPSRENAGEHEHDAIPEGQEESEDFYSRVQHLRGVFRLAADKCADIEAKALEHWLRAAAWWFLRGKTTLEASLRAAAPTSTNPKDKPPPQNLQAYVNLAKSWWIAEDVLPDLLDPMRPFARRNARGPLDGLDYGQVFEAQQGLLAAQRAFALLLAKRNALPPPALLVQGADPTVWLDAPPLPAGILIRTASLDPRTLQPNAKRPFFPILLADSRRHFSYGRVFGEAEIHTGDAAAAPVVLPCVVSIIRDRTSAQAELTITSQDGQLNAPVQADARAGPTWRDVEWRVKERRVRLRLGADLAVTLRLWEADFKTLWGIHDYLRRVEAERAPREGETCVFECVLPNFHYVPPPAAPGSSAAPTPFPTAPVRQCLARLFAQPGGAGCRLTVVTPPALKTLSSLTRAYGRGAPVLYSNLRGDAHAPALLVASRDDDGRRSSVVLTFADTAPRAEMLAHLGGLARASDEVASGDVPLSQLSLLDESGRELPLAARAQWSGVRVIAPAASESGGAGIKALMERGRVCATCNFGTVVDAGRLRAGELRLGLDIVNATMARLYRPAGEGLRVAFADNLAPKEEAEAARVAMRAAAAGPTATVFKFPTLAALHQFQALATGFAVAYDGHATLFSIARRRAGLPIHKRLESHLARLQVLTTDPLAPSRQGSTADPRPSNATAASIASFNAPAHHLAHLVAFLDDFPLGRCMTLQLRETDACEAVARGGKHLVRFVDAKFALPGASGAAEGAAKEGRRSVEGRGGSPEVAANGRRSPGGNGLGDFVCLDVLEYATEHDDILVGFDGEEERDTFARALPVGLTKASRMASLRH